jgi:quinol monooxygenase YgiN
MGDEIVVVAHFTANPGKEDELVALLHDLLKPTRKEPGCIRYELNQEVDNPRAFTFAEKFANREAFDAHNQAPHVERFRKQSQGLFASKEVRLHRELLPVVRQGESHAEAR